MVGFTRLVGNTPNMLVFLVNVVKVLAGAVIFGDRNSLVVPVVCNIPGLSRGTMTIRLFVVPIRLIRLGASIAFVLTR